MNKVAQKAQAITYANQLTKQNEECPRNVMNPGLYFGYMAGYEAGHRDATERLTKELERVRNNNLLQGERIAELENRLLVSNVTSVD